MPKVNIYENTRDGLNVETGEVIPARQPRRLSVGWSRDRHAQLGVGWVDTKPKVVLDAPEVRTFSSSFSPDFIVDGETDETGKVWLSQWMDLDRHTINQLIRELRKARDEAFGRDE